MTGATRRQDSYGQRRDQELHHFDTQTEVHALPAIAHYWSRKYLLPLLQEHGITEAHEFFAKYFLEAAAATGAPAVFASLGTGDCEIEVRTAQALNERGLDHFVIECLDLNARLLEKGRERANQAGVASRLRFVETDFNHWAADKQYTAVAASHSLHHMVELERVFDEVRRSLHPAGLFVVTDMIGRNGHMRWPEALEEMRPFWYELPREYRWNCLLKRLEEDYINHDCSTEGFEGIRAQDILPLLIERFDFRFFFAFSNLMDVFADRAFGHHFDVNRQWDRDFIDRVQAHDEQAILQGRLTPTHMYAAMTPGACNTHFYARGLTPADCVRPPNRTVAPLDSLTVTTCVLRPQEDDALSYKMRLTASGGRAPYAWSATDLPPGLTLRQDGTLEGTIEADGDFAPVITVTDSAKVPATATQRYTILVKPAAVPMPLSVRSPEELSRADVGRPYAEMLLASGGAAPLRWSVVDGALPQGLRLDATSGAIGGVPSRSERRAFWVEVTDSTGSKVMTRHVIAAGENATEITRAGVLPHVAVGGAWSSTICIVNRGAVAVDVELRIHASSGQHCDWALEPEPPAGGRGFQVGPRSTLRVRLAPGLNEELSGWVGVFASGPVAVHAELRHARASGASSEFSIPMDTGERAQLCLPFDNAEGNRTAVAVLGVPALLAAKATAKATGRMLVVLRDHAGRWMESVELPLRPGRHKAFMLADEMPATAGKRGTLEIHAPQQTAIAGVSLRVSANDVFSFLPAV